MKKRASYPKIPLQKIVLVRDKSVELPEGVDSGWQAAGIAKRLTDDSPDECLMVFCVDRDRKLISAQIVATGAADCVSFSPAQVFRAAIIQNAAAIIVAHNHPSGKPELSQADRQTYFKLTEAALCLGIQVLDFIVVTHKQQGYTSVHD